jgi:acetyl esterase/lipase
MTLKLAGLLACAAISFGASNSNPAKGFTGSVNIPLWENGQVPLAKGDGPLDRPFLTVFEPSASKRNGGSVVVAPGGSNIMLMYGCEGVEVAEHYNDWGVTAFVLTYRLSPRYGEDARLLDAKRAMQVVRQHAAEYGLDPKKVGFIGFSAGSSLARALAGATASNHTDERPDYLGLVYGPGRAAAGEQLKDFPPTFLLAAEFDKGASIGSAQLFADLTKAGAPAEIHIYQKGRHGFGTGFASANFSDWMGRLEHFLRYDGFLPGGGVE